MKAIKHNNKVVGVVDGKVYLKKCKKEHFMIKYHGFGISDKVLNKLKEIGVDTVAIVYDGMRGEKRYSSKLSDWLNSTKTSEYEGDKQSFLSLNEMSEDANIACNVNLDFKKSLVCDSKNQASLSNWRG